MRRFLAGILLLTAACSNTDRVTGPEAAAPGATPRASVSSVSTVRIRAQTTGPGGSLWYTTGGYELCGTSATPLQVGGNAVIVHWNTSCAPSAFSGSETYTYDGGVVHVYVVSDSGLDFVGDVLADLSQQGESFDIPAGATVQFQAVANPGCSFVNWRTSPVTVYGNPLTVTSGSYVAQFSCS